MTDRPVFAVDGRLRWMPSVVALCVSAVLYGVCHWLPVVTTADGSTPSAPVGPWWIGLPVLVALLVATRCGTGSSAVVVGAGAIAAGRLIADLGLFVTPDAVLRPELFGVDSVSAFPLSPAAGSALVVAADLLSLVAAGLAARVALAGWEPPVRRTDPGPSNVTIPRTFRFGPAPLAGLLAVALLVVSSLGVLYASPLPVVRPLGLADIGVFGLAGAMLGSLLVGVVVLLAAALPERAARGLYLGAGAAAAVAPLTALTAGGEVHPSGLAWVGFAGAVLLAAAGLLVGLTDRARRDRVEAGPSARPWAAPALGVLVLLTAGAALLAYREPQATTTLGEQLASFDAAGAGFLPAAVLLGVLGVLALVPPTAAVARLALRLGWLPVVAALLVSLEFSSSSVWVSSAIFGTGGVQRTAGSWWGIAAAVLAVVAAVLAAVLDQRLGDRDTPAVLDESGDDDRRRTAAAVVLTVLIVAAFALPVYVAADRDAAALFVGGARVDTYAAWLLAVGLVVAVWAGCRQVHRATSVTLLVTVALVALTRVALTPAVRHQVRFETRAGFTVTLVLAVAALAVAVLLARRTGPAPTPDPSPVRAAAPVPTPRGKRA